MIYLDHAATSWPKPPEVIRAMNDYLERSGGSPGRSGHRLSIAAGRIVYETRESIARLLGASDPMRVILTPNATAALNIALVGSLKPGDVVIASGVEHNAVMRPLRALEKTGVRLIVVTCDTTGAIDLGLFQREVKRGARMVVFNHASNVTGRIQPVTELARIAHESGATVVVDAAQTAGALPIDVEGMGVDLLAFTGHKSLQGPPGTGGLVIGSRVDPSTISPIIRGGTGSQSESQEQPDSLPDKFESGTPNGVGIAGLGAGVEWVAAKGVESIARHHDALIRRLVSGLNEITGVKIHGPGVGEPRTGLVSFTVDGHSVSEIGSRMDTEFDILCRVGLHCAPAAHSTLGTFPQGTARLSIGPMTTEDDIERAIDAVSVIAAS